MTTMMGMEMESIPPEVWWEVATHLRALKDVLSLARASRTCYEPVISCLYSRAAAITRARSWVPRERESHSVLCWAARRGDVAAGRKALAADSRDVAMALDVAAVHQQEEFIWFLLGWVGEGMETQGQCKQEDDAGACAYAGAYVVGDAADAGVDADADADAVGEQTQVRRYPILSGSGGSSNSQVGVPLLNSTAAAAAPPPPPALTVKSPWLIEIIQLSDPLLDSNLVLAARAGHDSTIRRLVDTGEQLDMDDPRILMVQPLVHLVSSHGNSSLTRFCLDAGHHPDQARKGAGPAALVIAIASGYESVCEMLVAAGAGLEECMLQHAAKFGHEAIFHRLLDTGRFRLQPSRCRCCDLELNISEAVMEFGTESMARRLLDSGVLAPDDKFGHPTTTPKTWVVQSGLPSNKFLNCLMKAKGDRDHQVEPGPDMTPLMWAAARGWSHDFARRLVGSGKVDHDATDGRGWTALHHAAAYGEESMARFLIDVVGVEPDMVATDGMTPFLIASSLGKEGLARYLLDSGRVDPARTVMREDRCETALSLALAWSGGGGQSLADHLLDSGAVKPDPAAVAAAMSMSSESLIYRILEAVEDQLPVPELNLKKAARRGFVSVVEWLLQSGRTDLRGLIENQQLLQSPEYKDFSLYTLLEDAVLSGNTDVVRVLLKSGHFDDDDVEEFVFVECRRRGWFGYLTLPLGPGWSAPMVRCFFENFAARGLLRHDDDDDDDEKLKPGCSILFAAAGQDDDSLLREVLDRYPGLADWLDAPDEHGRTPLMVAACTGSERVLRFLLASGRVDVDRQDIFGFSVLMCASYGWGGLTERDATVRLLLEQGRARPHLRAMNGRIALHFAAVEGNLAAIKTLLLWDSGGALDGEAQGNGYNEKKEEEEEEEMAYGQDITGLKMDPDDPSKALELAWSRGCLDIADFLLGSGRVDEFLRDEKRFGSLVQDGMGGPGKVISRRYNKWLQEETLDHLLNRLAAVKGGVDRAIDEDGRTALHVAVKEMEILPYAMRVSRAMLLDEGASIYEKDFGGVSPLGRAIASKQIPAVRQLLCGGGKGARRAEPDSSVTVALENLPEEERSKMRDILLAAGEVLG